MTDRGSIASVSGNNQDIFSQLMLVRDSRGRAVAVCLHTPRYSSRLPLSFISAPRTSKGTDGESTAQHQRGIDGLVRSLRSIDLVVKKFLSRDSFKYLVAGALAGMISRTVVSPLEVIATINICSTRSSLGIIGELKKLLLEEGVRGLFKGNAANCMKVAPTRGIQFLAFEGFKRWIFASRDPKSHQFSSPLTSLERLMAGGCAGVASALVCYPLEVAKTLLTAHPEKYSGVFSTIAKVAKQNGPQGLYRGLGPTLVAMFPYVGLEFMIYEQLKLLYTQRTKKEPSILVLLTIGAFAGMISQTVCHPLDVVRKRLQLQGIGGRPIQYRSMMDATLGIVRNEGPRSLFRGLHPTYMSVLPSQGVSYVVYEGLKQKFGVTSFK